MRSFAMLVSLDFEKHLDWRHDNSGIEPSIFWDSCQRKESGRAKREEGTHDEDEDDEGEWARRGADSAAAASEGKVLGPTKRVRQAWVTQSSSSS